MTEIEEVAYAVEGLTKSIDGWADQDKRWHPGVSDGIRDIAAHLESIDESLERIANALERAYPPPPDAP